MALNLMRWFQPGAVTKAETPKTSSTQKAASTSDDSWRQRQWGVPVESPNTERQGPSLGSQVGTAIKSWFTRPTTTKPQPNYDPRRVWASSTDSLPRYSLPKMTVEVVQNTPEAQAAFEAQEAAQENPVWRPGESTQRPEISRVTHQKPQSSGAAKNLSAADLFKPGAIKKQGINEFAELDDAGYAALSAEKRAIVDFNTQLQAALDKDAALKGQKADDDYIQRANKLFASDDAGRSYNPNTLSLLETLGADLKNTKMDDYTSGRMNLSFEDLTSTAKTKGVSKEFYDGLQESIQRPTAQRAFGRADFANLVSESTAKRMTDVIMRGQSFLGGEADTSLSLDSETADKFDYLYNIMTGFSADETGAPILDASGSPSRVDGATYENMVESINAEGLDLATFQTYADRRLRSELYDLNGDDDYLKLRSAYLPEIERALFGGG